MNRSLKTAVGIVAALGIGAAIAAYAQPPGFGYGPGMMGGGMMGMMGNAMMGNPMLFADTERLARLKTELKITPNQEQVWQSYARAVKQQRQGIETLAQARQALYSALTPEQKTLAGWHFGNADGFSPMGGIGPMGVMGMHGMGF